MNIGLQFLNQIRGTEQEGTPSPDEIDPVKKLGGWVAQQVTSLVAALTASYHKEHNSDDTHGAIHCTSISEHGRLIPAGEWVQAPIGTGTFAGSGTMTVLVPSTYRTYAYTLIGKTMIVSYVLDGVTVGGVASQFIKIKIPAGYIAARFYSGAVGYASDNGVAVGANADVQAPSVTSEPYIFLYRTDLANWTASAANTALHGSITFEVQ